MISLRIRRMELIPSDSPFRPFRRVREVQAGTFASPRSDVNNSQSDYAVFSTIFIP
jgi:hypothetical protein